MTLALMLEASLDSVIVYIHIYMAEFVLIVKIYPMMITLMVVPIVPTLDILILYIHPVEF